ncbi:MAG: hypothetical protein RIC55_31790 [Pirellulaceae bacterium]
MKIRVLAVCLFLTMPFAAVLSAEDADSSSLAEQAREAASSYTPATPARLQQARQQARKSLAALSSRLAREGENGAAWRRYALLDRLEAQLAGDSPEVQVFRDVIDRLSRSHAGLESPLYRGLRTDLLRYAGALESIADSAEQEYQTRMTELAELLTAAETDADHEQRRRIGEQLAWLEDHQQASHVVAAVRRRYGRPNFLLTVSQRVLDGFSEPFSSDEPFQETILNTPTFGQGLIKGVVRMKFAPSDEGAAIDIHLQAEGDADTVSVKGPVRVYSTGRLNLTGRKRILFTPEGLDVSRSTAVANNEGRPTGVATTLRGLAHRIVCRIAWRQISKSTGEAEAEANMKAERRIREKFDAEAAKELDELSALYLENVRLPLLRRRQFPARIEVRTTAERMLLELSQADRDQLAAPLPPPALTGASDFAVRLHESTVNNLAVKLLGGETLSVNELLAEIDDLLGEQTETDSPSTDQDEEIEITFDQHAPITLRLDDSVVSLTIRGTRYVANRRPYPAMNITIRYKVEMTPQGARATLVEDPEILPPRLAAEKGRLSLTELAVRRILKNRLERDLDREMNASGFEIPSDAFDLGELPIEQLAADDGWIVFSARVAPKPQADDAAQ